MASGKLLVEDKGQTEAASHLSEHSVRVTSLSSHYHHLLAFFLTTNLTGHSRLLGEETSRNHQAYKERPPRHHNIRELKQLRRRQLHKTIDLMIKTTALHVHHAF